MSLCEKSFKQLNEMIEEVAYRFFVAKRLITMRQKGEILEEYQVVKAKLQFNEEKEPEQTVEPVYEVSF